MLEELPASQWALRFRAGAHLCNAGGTTSEPVGFEISEQEPIPAMREELPATSVL